MSLRVRAGVRNEAVSAVESMVARMCRTEGCGGSRALTAIEDASQLIVWSEWSDVHSAEAYFESRSFRAFCDLQILLREEPCVVFDQVSARFTTTMSPDARFDARRMSAAIDR